MQRRRRRRRRRDVEVSTVALARCPSARVGCVGYRERG